MTNWTNAHSTNVSTTRVVYETVCWSVNQDVVQATHEYRFEVVDWAVGAVVDRSRIVIDASFWATNRVGDWAEYEAARDDPDHPALQSFLGAAGVGAEALCSSLM